MRKHVIGIIILGVWVLAACIYGISLVGTPADQKLIGYDERRISNFQMLKYRVEDYYRTNGKLPASLNETTNIESYRFDPETKKEYEYKKLTDTTWEFCAVFSTDSKEIEKKKHAGQTRPTSPYTTEDEQHTKGRDCIEYKIADYMIQTSQRFNTPTSVLQPTEAAKPSTPSAKVISVKKTGDCRWDIYFQLDGMDTARPLTVKSEGQLTKCDADKLEPYFWIDEVDQKTSIVNYYHVDYGTYSYTFTDKNGKSASVTFTYNETSPDTYTP